MKFEAVSKLKLFVVLTITLMAVACGSTSQRGGYYQDDGPGSKKVDINAIPNAVPRNEPYIQSTLKPYTALGKRYIPLKSSEGYKEEGFASWYGKKYHGRKTSSGEVYDMYKMTAAHPTLPLPSYVKVTNAVNQRSVVVRVNDRGPFIGNRIIDLSYVAAQKLGVVSAGTGRVIVETISSSTDFSLKAESKPNSQSPSQNNQLLSQNNRNSPVVSVGEIPPSDPLVSRQNTQITQLVPQSVKPSTDFAGDSLSGKPFTNNDVEPQGFWLQIGAFSVMANAQELLTRLKISGYQNSQISQKQSLFKVLVGPLSQQQLEITQQDLRSNGYSVIVAK